MPRITGFDIPDEKKISFSLCYIYGVGPKLAGDILTAAKIDLNKRAKELTADEINRIAKELEKQAVGGQLRRIVRDNIDRLRRIASYRGLRHRQGLPVRGQRTRTNARTGRGKRKTVGALSKEVATNLEKDKDK
jgi:small subunit ribosomal protein S13